MNFGISDGNLRRYMYTACSIPAARQLVAHGQVQINGQRVGLVLHEYRESF